MSNPPKPTALKMIEGTYRRDRANPAEPKPAVGAEPPAYLPKRGPARAAWDRLSATLVELRVLTVADADALALACLALEEYLAARRLSRPRVPGGAPDAGAMRRADAAWKRYRASLTDFGLTPSSRTRVSAVPPTERDPMAEWLAGAPSADPPPVTPRPKRSKSATPADPVDAWLQGETDA